MFTRFLSAYITCAFWSSTDNSDESGGEPLDANYSAEDLAPEALATMTADCERFYADFEDDIERVSSQAGHDFWLTRNGYGAGFWDRDEDTYPISTEVLTKASKAFGTQNLYVGDDGQIYVG